MNKEFETESVVVREDEENKKQVIWYRSISNSWSGIQSLKIHQITHIHIAVILVTNEPFSTYPATSNSVSKIPNSQKASWSCMFKK